MNDDNDKNIFIKRSSLPPAEHKVSLDAISESIPTVNVHEQPQYHLRKNKTEWRWRVFKLDDRKFIEISTLKPNNPRRFVDKYGKWVDYQMDPEFDKYVDKEVYYYADK